MVSVRPRLLLLVLFFLFFFLLLLLLLVLFSGCGPRLASILGMRHRQVPARSASSIACDLISLGLQSTGRLGSRVECATLCVCVCVCSSSFLCFSFLEGTLFTLVSREASRNCTLVPRGTHRKRSTTIIGVPFGSGVAEDMFRCSLISGLA